MGFLNSVFMLVRFLLDSVKVCHDHVCHVISQEMVLDLDLRSESGHPRVVGHVVHDLLLELLNVYLLILDLGLLGLEGVAFTKAGVQLGGPFVKHLLQVRVPSVDSAADGLVGGRARLRLDGASLGD